jgi:hypothetical protein
MSTKARMKKLGCLVALVAFVSGCDDAEPSPKRSDACGALAALDAGMQDASERGRAGSNAAGNPSSALMCPPQPMKACEDMEAWPEFGWSVIAEAAEFGDGARFVGAGADAVLVEGGTAPWRAVIVAYGNDERDERDSIWTFPAGEWRGIDALTVYGERFFGVFALACGAGSEDPCRLLYGASSYADDAGAAELRELAGGEVPDGIEPSGLVYDPALDAVCVFGNALVCFDTHWTTMIGPDCGVRFVDVAWAPRSTTMIALAEHGRWWMRVESASGTLEPWVEQARIDADDVPVGASVASDFAELFGRRTVWPVSIFNGAVKSCAQEDELSAAFAAQTVVFRAGHVHGYLSGSCDAQLDLGTGPVIDWSFGLCIDSLNPRVLTPTRLLGTTNCLNYE